MMISLQRVDLTVFMVTFVCQLLLILEGVRAHLKCAIMDNGGQCVLMDGMMLMPL